MGQQSCKRFLDNSSPNPKSALLNQQLLSEYVLPDKQNYQSLSVMSISYIPQASNLSTKYTDLLIALKSMKWKFEDSFYERPTDIQWRRLSDYKSIQKVLHNPISKFCQIIKFIIKNYPDLMLCIKPVYVQKLGFAVCKLWINGNVTEVIVDDYLPVEKISYNIQPWVLLLQKSMSKVLGSYRYLEQFTAGQIFTQVTGIPHYKYLQKQQQSPNQKYKTDYESKNFKKFKQVLKCDQLLFQTKRFSQDSSIFGYHQNYKISHISFQGQKNKPSLIKMCIQQRQNISIRVIQPLQKYKQNYQNYLTTYNNLFFECFVQRNGIYVPFGQKHQINNCIYLNSVFTNLQPGNYFFYVRHTKQQQKLNFIAYSHQTNVKLIQIYNQSLINNLIFSYFKSMSSDKLTFQHMGCQVFAHIQYNNSQIALFFQKNYESRVLKLEIQNYALFIQQDPKIYREISLNQVKGKCIIILCTNHNQSIKKGCFSIA